MLVTTELSEKGLAHYHILVGGGPERASALMMDGYGGLPRHYPGTQFEGCQCQLVFLFWWTWSGQPSLKSHFSIWPDLESKLVTWTTR